MRAICDPESAEGAGATVMNARGRRLGVIGARSRLRRNFCFLVRKPGASPRPKQAASAPRPGRSAASVSGPIREYGERKMRRGCWSGFVRQDASTESSCPATLGPGRTPYCPRTTGSAPHGTCRVRRHILSHSRHSCGAHRGKKEAPHVGLEPTTVRYRIQRLRGLTEVRVSNSTD